MKRRSFLQSVATAINPNSRSTTSRFDLRHPWHVDGRTIASDGRIALIIDGDAVEGVTGAVPSLSHLPFDQLDSRGWRPLSLCNWVGGNDGSDLVGNCMHCYGRGWIGNDVRLIGWNEWDGETTCAACDGSGFRDQNTDLLSVGDVGYGFAAGWCGR